MIKDLMTPKERLIDMADKNPSQCVAVAIVGQNVEITYGFNETKDLVAMLQALEEELKRVISKKPFKLM